MGKAMRVALASLPAAMLVVGLAAGCSRNGAAPAAASPVPVTPSPAASAGPPVSPSPSATGPAVTAAEAARVTREILAADDVLRVAGGERDALLQTRDGQRSIISAQFRSTGLAPRRFTWGEPKLLVPRLVRPPLWFAAVAERRDRGGGHPRTAVLVFMKESDTALWQLSFASLLYPGVSLPEVARDAEGYATALSTRDSTTAISPHLMAPLHATIAEEGPGGFAAGLIAAGPQTTGYFAEVQKITPDAKRRGFLYDSLFAATTFPIYALRTADGGALILYSLTRKTLTQAKTDNAFGLVPVPKDVRWAVKRPVVRSRLSVEQTQQYISHVRRKGAAEPARIIAFDGAPTRVSGD
ncbi:hypothetical protein Sru01_03310 [Sphaerisporangium rufum]|uniref:DUF8094 domain-containing protein n=1 Tax=Sphaerisporangium rufum TaxID=1381558 RepID=A0A919QWF2_9ACTN|nr:hypothetical protein [Sphaerisporangium rufum]GII75349.1 hypothetical protein Sru01_03310 [Sphaerisporangium rufum]